MTPDEMEHQFRLDMKSALQDAQKRKWLGAQWHGYCFSCAKETLVYDVIAESSPPQPPKCEECFIHGAIDFLESPEAERIIKEFRENGFEGLE